MSLSVCRLVYTECLPGTCPCQEQCSNQRIQKLEWIAGLEKFPTPNRGYGVRTNQSVASGNQYLLIIICCVKAFETQDSTIIESLFISNCFTEQFVTTVGCISAWHWKTLASYWRLFTYHDSYIMEQEKMSSSLDPQRK